MLLSTAFLEKRHVTFTVWWVLGEDAKLGKEKKTHKME